MKALRISGEQQVALLDREIPKPIENEVVIKMMATGICGSDLHPYRHPTPVHLDPGFISGHEPCGVVHEVGPGVEGWQVGDPAVVYFRRTCGKCIYCQTGHSEVCIDRGGSYGHAGHDGSHAEYMRVETKCLMRKPDHITFMDGAIISCQAGTAYWPLKRLGVSGRDVLAVSGLGPVGLLATVFAKAMGTTIVGIDPSAERRALAERLGADVTIDPTAGPVGEQVKKHVKLGADKLIETSGSGAAHAVIGDVVRPMADVAIVGLGNPEFKMPLMHLAHRQLNVFGSSIYPITMFEEICDFLKRHDVSLESVVTHRLPLEQGAEAFATAAAAHSGKVCFEL
jgi:(R,R)-butanediol dehydrogenase/meso-butanediol dehydrogenase/diacetyl reductase